MLAGSGIADSLPHFLPHPVHALRSPTHELGVADTFENATDVTTSQSVGIEGVAAVAYKPTGGDE